MELSCAEERVVRRRTRRDPEPRYLADVSSQLDAVRGCPQLQVAGEHLCRRIQAVIDKLDTSELHGRYSSLGRHGHDPARLFAIWVYASAIGIHEASKVEAACKSDAAFRLLAGGWSPSAATLKRFRLRFGDFLQRMLQQTVELAHQQGLLKTDELAVDSMRLRAHASMGSVRRKSIAEKRVQAHSEKLKDSSLTEEQRQEYERALERNKKVVQTCVERDEPNIIQGNALAGLMKFPHGGAVPGHRLTVTAAGASERIVIGVLIDGAPNDTGKLKPSLEQTLEVLQRVGVPREQRLGIVADAGYWDTESLQLAQRLADRADVLIAEGRRAKPKQSEELSRDDFQLSDDMRSVTCPAGRLMRGPESAGRGKRRWYGDGCSECSLKARCTSGKRRKFEIQLEYEKASQAMRARMQTSDAQARYAKRAAIIEPVFASVQSEMGFRRASSRNSKTIIAEVLLKLLAHNIRRLANAPGLFCVLWLTADDSGSWHLLHPENTF